MWRNPASFSCAFLSRTRHNPRLFPISLPNDFYARGSRGGVLTVLIAPAPSSSSSHIHSSAAEIHSPLDSLKPGLSRCLQSDHFAASPASVGASFAPYPSIFKGYKDAAGVIRHYTRCYWELSKARLSMLVVATSGTGFILGSGGIIDVGGLCFTCAGTMMVAASANSLNQVFEIRNDSKMKRTIQRPLPSGRISIPHAILWASSVGVAGTTLLVWKTNVLTAGLAASTLALYAFIYTPLKQIHPVNTWVGAVVGAIPPLLGWTAACDHVSLNAMVLPAALYFWQIPHFMALAYLCRDDYAAGGFKMFSLADASGQRTASVALRNCLYLLPLGFLAHDWGMVSEWFCIESSLFTMVMAAGALSFYRNCTARSARKMFYTSLLYLPVFMSGLILHRLPNSQEELMTGLDQPSELPLSPHQDVDTNDRVKARNSRSESHVCPPVAYASVAPFPFLPAPVYASPDPLA